MANASERLALVVDNILSAYFCPRAHTPVNVMFDVEKTRLAYALRLGLAVRGHSIGEWRLVTGAVEFADVLKRGGAADGSALIALGGGVEPSMPALGKRRTMRFYAHRAQSGGKSDSQGAPVFHDGGLPMQSMLRLFSADPAEIDRYLTEIRGKVAESAEVRITAPGGTDLMLTARRWVTQSWTLTTCPEASSVEGTVVVDSGVFFGPVRSPIVLVIRRGRLEDLVCDDPTDPVFCHYARIMAGVRDRNPDSLRVAMVGFGGNPNAEVSDDVLESVCARDVFHLSFADTVLSPDSGEPCASGWHGGTVFVRAPRIHGCVAASNGS